VRNGNIVGAIRGGGATRSARNINWF